MTRTQLHLHAVLASVLGLVTTACSGSGHAKGTSDDGGQTSDGGALSLSAFCTAFMTANDTLLQRCIGGDEATWGQVLPPQYSCAALEAAVAAGRVTYHPSFVADCLDGYPTLSCSDLFVGPMACFGPLAGTVADGSACFADGDCGGTSYCNGTGHGESSCQGKCTPLLAAGAKCTQAEECATGYSCGGEPTSTTCISNIHPLANVGASCAILAPTMPQTQCNAGLTCNRHSFVCAPTVSVGGACSAGEGLCETFTYCDSATSKCVPNPGAGGVCGTSTAGELMECLPQLACHLANPMDPTGTCVALGAAGAACTGDFECVSGSCSSQTGAGTCSKPCTLE